MKLTKLCLFLVALFATVCLVGCGGDPEPSPEVETVRTVAFFDFNTAKYVNMPYAPSGDGATVGWEADKGIDGTGCLKVTQTEEYGEVLLDLKKAYSKGKTYYFEGMFKDAETPESVNGGTTYASMSITVEDQDIMDISEANGAESWAYKTDWPNPSPSGIYAKDQPDPWSCSIGDSITGYEEKVIPYLVKDEDGNTLNPKPTNVEISYDGWTKVNGIVRSEDIDVLVSKNTPEDLVTFSLVYLCGVYPDQIGYIYYLDNLRILDLDPQIPLGEGVHVTAPTLTYGSDNVVSINIYAEENDDVFIKNKGTADYSKFSCTGTLPTGLTFDKESGVFTGNIPASLVEEGDAEGKSYTVTVTATNKAGSATATVTFKITNAEPQEEEPVEEETEITE